ncbi:MAG TPA: hypothetical protein PLB21_02915 [Actinomycetota bacterium]|nr:hypothetical protein [Actinomycetota bacterium]
MSITIDGAIASGQVGVKEMRHGVATAEKALGLVDHALELSDRMLVDADRGLAAAERAVVTGRRVAPKVAIGVTVAVVVIVGLVVARKLRNRTPVGGHNHAHVYAPTAGEPAAEADSTPEATATPAADA